MQHSSAQPLPPHPEIHITQVVILERRLWISRVLHRRIDARERVLRLLAWMHRLAEAGWASTAVGIWALLQAALVPGPVEAVFVPLGLADPRRVWRFAASATVGTFIGALTAYAIGHFAFATLGVPLLGLLGFGADDIQRSRAMFADHGWVLVAVSTVTPVSLKLASIAAGAFGVPLVLFGAIVVVGRTIRYTVTALLLRFAGERLQRWACAARLPGPRGGRDQPPTSVGAATANFPARQTALAPPASPSRSRAPRRRRA